MPAASSRRRRGRWRVAAVLLLVGAAISGCGGGGQAEGPGVTVRSRSWSGPDGVRGELRPPAGGEPARLLVMLIHGGGWTGPDPKQFAATEGVAAAYRAAGYATLVVDYRRGAKGVADVNRFYVQARRAVGPRLPICAAGGSAGGHLALVLAARHPDLACAISLAGPTDLVSLSRADPQTGAELASLFGSGRLDALSPARHAGRIRARLLLVYAANDPIVPVAQGREMARARPGSDLIVLPPGPETFVHSSVASGSQARVDAAQRAMLQRATESGG